MKIRKVTLYYKTISLLLLGIFCLQEVSYCAPPLALTGHETPLEILSQDPTRLESSPAFSSLREIHSGRKDAPLIIHIQDAHSNFSGQQNLANTLDSLMTRYGVSLILVEGASQEVTLDSLKKLAPSKEICKRVAKSFLIQGKISGEESLNLSSDHPMKIMGIEDGDLYEKSVASYGLLVEKRQDILDYLKVIQKALDKLKQKLYPLEILDYEKEDRADGKGFEKSLKKILCMAQDKNINLDDFPAIHKLSALLEKEKNIDFNAANLEQATLLEKLGDEAFSIKSLSKTKNSKASQWALFQNIFSMAKEKNVALQNHPNLVLYGEYLKEFSDVDMDAVLEEMQEAEERVMAASLGSDCLLIHAIDRYTKLLNTAYRIRMSTQEFKSFQVNEPDFATLSYLAFINRRLAELGFFDDLIPHKSLLEDGQKALTDFYESVDQRDTAFVRNADRILRQENQKVAVLITGGYHTPHLKRLFKQQGWSWAVLTPIITSETNQENYEKLLLAPLRKEVKKVSLVNGESMKIKDPRDDFAGSEVFLNKKSDGVRAEAAMVNAARFAELSDALGIHGARMAADEAEVEIKPEIFSEDNLLKIEKIVNEEFFHYPCVNKIISKFVLEIVAALLNDEKGSAGETIKSGWDEARVRQEMERVGLKEIDEKLLEIKNLIQQIVVVRSLKKGREHHIVIDLDATDPKGKEVIFVHRARRANEHDSENILISWTDDEDIIDVYIKKQNNSISRKTLPGLMEYRLNYLDTAIDPVNFNPREAVGTPFITWLIERKVVEGARRNLLALGRARYSSQYASQYMESLYGYYRLLHFSGWTQEELMSRCGISLTEDDLFSGYQQHFLFQIEKAFENGDILYNPGNHMHKIVRSGLSLKEAHDYYVKKYPEKWSDDLERVYRKKEKVFEDGYQSNRTYCVPLTRENFRDSIKIDLDYLFRPRDPSLFGLDSDSCFVWNNLDQGKKLAVEFFENFIYSEGHEAIEHYLILLYIARRLEMSVDEISNLRAQRLRSSEKHILDVVKERGRISYAELWDTALFDKTHGWYNRLLSPEKLVSLEAGSEFVEITAMYPDFARGLAIDLFSRWKNMGKPGTFTIVEVGGGNGILADGILSFVYSKSTEDVKTESSRAWVEFGKALQYQMVEKSHVLKVLQERKFPEDKIKILTPEEFERVQNNSITGAIISNAVPDTFPVYKITLRGGIIQEVFIEEENGILIEKFETPSTPELKTYLAAYPIEMEEGDVFFVNVAAEKWLEMLGSKLKDGSIFISDYGADTKKIIERHILFPQARAFGDHVREQKSRYVILSAGGYTPSIFSYRGNPLSLVGLKDITTDVDFDPLIAVGNQMGSLSFYGSAGDYFSRISWGDEEIEPDHGLLTTSDQYRILVIEKNATTAARMATITVGVVGTLEEDSPIKQIERILVERVTRPDPHLLERVSMDELEGMVDINQGDPFGLWGVSQTIIEARNLLKPILEITRAVNAEYADHQVLVMDRDAGPLYDALKILGHPKEVYLFPMTLDLWEEEGFEKTSPEVLQGQLALFGITKESINSGEKFLILDTGFRGSAGNAIRGMVSRAFSIDPNEDFFNQFPSRLIGWLPPANFVFSASQATAMVNGEPPLEIFDASSHGEGYGEIGDLFPISSTLVKYNPRNDGNWNLTHAIAMQRLPKFHGSNTYSPERGFGLMPSSGNDLNFDRNNTANLIIVNPWAAVLFQKMLVDYLLENRGSQTGAAARMAAAQVSEAFEELWKGYSNAYESIGGRKLNRTAFAQLMTRVANLSTTTEQKAVSEGEEKIISRIKARISESRFQKVVSQLKGADANDLLSVHSRGGAGASPPVGTVDPWVDGIETIIGLAITSQGHRTTQGDFELTWVANAGGLSGPLDEDLIHLIQGKRLGVAAYFNPSLSKPNQQSVTLLVRGGVDVASLRHALRQLRLQMEVDSKFRSLAVNGFRISRHSESFQTISESSEATLAQIIDRIFEKEPDRFGEDDLHELYVIEPSKPNNKRELAQPEIVTVDTPYSIRFTPSAFRDFKKFTKGGGTLQEKLFTIFLGILERGSMYGQKKSGPWTGLIDAELAGRSYRAIWKFEGGTAIFVALRHKDEESNEGRGAHTELKSIARAKPGDIGLIDKKETDRWLLDGLGIKYGPALEDGQGHVDGARLVGGVAVDSPQRFLNGSTANLPAQGFLVEESRSLRNTNPPEHALLKKLAIAARRTSRGSLADIPLEVRGSVTVVYEVMDVTTENVRLLENQEGFEGSAKDYMGGTYLVLRVVEENGVESRFYYPFTAQEMTSQGSLDLLGGVASVVRTIEFTDRLSQAEVVSEVLPLAVQVAEVIASQKVDTEKSARPLVLAVSSAPALENELTQALMALAKPFFGERVSVVFVDPTQIYRDGNTLSLSNGKTFAIPIDAQVLILVNARDPLVLKSIQGGQHGLSSVADPKAVEKGHFDVANYAYPLLLKALIYQTTPEGLPAFIQNHSDLFNRILSRMFPGKSISPEDRLRLVKFVLRYDPTDISEDELHEFFNQFTQALHKLTSDIFSASARAIARAVLSAA